MATDHSPEQSTTGHGYPKPTEQSNRSYQRQINPEKPWILQNTNFHPSETPYTPTKPKRLGI